MCKNATFIQQIFIDHGHVRRIECLWKEWNGILNRIRHIKKVTIKQRHKKEKYVSHTDETG